MLKALVNTLLPPAVIDLPEKPADRSAWLS